MIIPEALHNAESNCEIELYHDCSDRAKTTIVMAQLVMILWGQRDSARITRGQLVSSVRTFTKDFYSGVRNGIQKWVP